MTVEAAVIDTAGDALSGCGASQIAVLEIDPAVVARVASAVGELVSGDMSGLPDDVLLEVHDAVARLGRLADTLEAQSAGEIARRSTPDQPGGGLARRRGFGGAGALVARATGGSVAGAMRSIEAGLAFMPDALRLGTSTDQLDRSDPTLPCAPPASSAPRYPVLAAAARAGDLSVEAASLIATGLETLADRVPSSQLHELEAKLVGKAVHLAAHEVRRLVATAVARADVAGLEERERRQYDERFVTWTEDHTGVVTFAGRLDAVTAAPVRTVIEQMVTQAFRARRDGVESSADPSEVDKRTVGQMRADALFEICRHALGCGQTDRSGVRTTMVVRINESDLDTGHGVGSIDGTSVPVSVGELRRLAGDAGIIPEVLGEASEVLDLGRRARVFTVAQRLALLERDGGCAKCHAPPEHCEAHHIRWWENGGTTDLGNGVMLCTRCHHDIHRQGWEIRVRAGGVEFVPPPSIDPTRGPRQGGRAAITVDDGGDPHDGGDPRDGGDARDGGDPRIPRDG